MTIAKSEAGKTKVLIVDDQASVRSAVKEWLDFDPRLRIVGQAADGLDALVLAQELQPDIVLVDFNMPNMDGIAMTAALREAVPWIKVVILSIYDDPTTRARATAAGAVAFVAKHDPVEMLLSVLHDLADQRP